jgi:hypothetical protein
MVDAEQLTRPAPHGKLAPRHARVLRDFEPKRWPLDERDTARPGRHEVSPSGVATQVCEAGADRRQLPQCLVKPARLGRPKAGGPRNSERSRLRALGALSALKRARSMRPCSPTTARRSACASSSSNSLRPRQSAPRHAPGPAQHRETAGLDARHHLPPQVVAAVAQIGVALVFNPGQRMRLAVAGNDRPRQFKQGPDQTRPPACGRSASIPAAPLTPAPRNSLKSTVSA